MKPRFSPPALLVSLWFFLSGTRASATGAENGAADHAALQPFIAAGDARFRYAGRLDLTDRDAPVIVWEGSRISLDFTGSKLVLRWGEASGQNFFNVQVDDATEVAGVPAGPESRTEWTRPLSAGRHRLTLFKRTEGTAGQVRFKGVELAAGGQASLPAAPAYKLRMEVHGDSITAGACDEDGETDQWDDRRTHNFALSYAPLTATKFSADLRCEAVSGIGIVTGWVDFTSGQMWDRIYPRKDSPRDNLAAWLPDVVLINLGDNDDDFPRSRQQPFPANFGVEYIKLVHAIRAANPRAEIVLLMGGMYSGSQSVPLREAWTAAVKTLETADPAISHFVFKHWTSHHPRVADHRVLADELNAWLQQQAFMQKFL
jgi:lysophospholipase L1-like esterase